jgi:putative hydrolase of the HAD superfamily
LFHTLVSVPPPALSGEPSVPELLGVPTAEWQRRYYDEDVLGRCVGRVTNALDAMRLVTHAIDPTVSEERIHAAVVSRRRRFETGLTKVDPLILHAIDRVRAAGIRTGIVSDAGADDVESWAQSPLSGRFDAVVFSYQIGVRKPAAGIYHHALGALGVGANGVFFVGDGGSEEHRGAREVGLHTVLVTRLLGLYWPNTIPGRRGQADWEFPDVPAFVDALDL